MVIGRMIFRLFCWAIMRKMIKKWDLETLNAETKPKIRIYAKKTKQNKPCWNFLTFVKKSTLNSGSQRLTCADVNWWCRHWSVQDDDRPWWSRACRARGGWVSGACSACVLVAAHGSVWSICSTIKSFRRCMRAHVRSFLVVLGWVLLDIGCSVTLCLCFGSWMNRTMRSDSCRDYGCDGGDSLLTVTTGWRWGQWKNANDVHKNQKVRVMALIPCSQYKVREKDWIVCILMCI